VRRAAEAPPPGLTLLSVSALARATLAQLQAASYKAAAPGSLASLREAPALARAAVLIDELCALGVPETTDPEVCTCASEAAARAVGAALLCVAGS